MRPAMIEWADYTDTSRCQFTVLGVIAADAMDANMKHVRYESAVVAAGSQARREISLSARSHQSSSYLLVLRIKIPTVSIRTQGHGTTLALVMSAQPDE